ncbi:XRE family transcriptional regulator [Mesorhizobium sp. M7A.F.Ca.US.001.04.1.1]|uniref:helix-turn-helix domain-containing protein n=1 Tax=unclassified Mesorhizobium TaxID=325217 RepID=UPI000FCC7997|nr:MULTISPECIES: XRE family transcriptional regulator [unclassified Mesorhizobium]RUY20833.1 XRE family transcriptional regulator [Mesorhizobium sp. M7A.F.Ca.US.001.04.2.1]RUY33584.1 XRE family transcriptional regulator [Mesorhizobium sp. M7A.F.Ca.US.001.04.1.1]
MTETTTPLETEQELGQAIAIRIQNLRRDQNLTLDRLAKLTGLSKGTVVALEQGKANPSIGILCRLAAAFSLSVADLLNDAPSTAPDHPIERSISRTLWTSAKGSRAQLHTSTSGRTMFELWSWVLMPGDVFAADAHSPDTRELLSVTKGSLKVTVGSHEIILSPGESAHLVTDQPHSYAAASDVPALFSMAVLERGGQRVPTSSPPAATSPLAVSPRPR